MRIFSHSGQMRRRGAARNLAAAICCVVLGIGGITDATGAENVAGVSVDHVAGFKANKTMSRKSTERLRDTRVPVESVDAFEADVPWANKRITGTVYVVRTKYRKGFKRGLDEVVQETFDDITEKYGDKAGVLLNKRVRVNGLDAQRLSFTLQVDDVTVGAETLVLQNRTQDVLWIVQVVFDESSPGPKGSLAREARRLKAAQIVDSVRTATAVKAP
jgi:hypothetical protein